MITRETDYALRALVQLAVVYTDKGSVRTTTLADSLAVPYRFLRRILYKLTQTGYIETQRGRGGGVRLRVNPVSLTLHEIIHRLDPRSVALNLCTNGSPHCCDRLALCPVHGRLQAAQQALDAELKQATLADLAADVANQRDA